MRKSELRQIIREEIKKATRLDENKYEYYPSKVIKYTNHRLKRWYAEVKRSYGVVGSGFTTIKGDTITITYTEDGVTKKWDFAYYDEYVDESGIDYFFNVWQEQG
jgi:hypothetical protein